MNPKKVFISYSHDTPEHEKRVLSLINRLRCDGVDCNLDRYETALATGWPRWNMVQLEQIAFVLMVFTGPRMENGTGTVFESTLLLESIYDSHSQNRCVIPVVFQPEDEQYIPGPLRGFSRYCLDSEAGYGALYRHLTGKPKIEKNGLAPVITSLSAHEAEEEKLLPGSTVWLTSQPPRALEFMGRDRDTSKLADALEREHAVVLVNGIGGIGKTELCKHYIWKESDRYSRIAWIDYQGTLSESLVRAFDKSQPGFNLDPESPFAERYRCLLGYLESLSPDTLLVVDNLDNPEDPDLEVLLRLPLKVLVSSRRELASFSFLRLDFLDAGVCRELFLRHYRPGGEVDEGALARVIRLSGKHTLTIELLAKTARKGLLTVSGLLERLEAEGFNLDEAIPTKVETLWNRDDEQSRFFGHLRKMFRVSRLSEAEMEFLVNLSLLPDMVGFGAEELDTMLSPQAPALAGELADRGWLLREGNQVLQHPVISEVVRYESPPTAERCRGLINKIADLLDVEPTENPLDKGRYVPLGVSVLERLPEEDEDIAGLASGISNIYSYQGQLEQALEYQLKATTIREKILAPNHSDLAQSYNNLAGIYQSLGKLEQALEYQLKATTTMEKPLTPFHPYLATSYNNLALIYKDQGQLEQALEYQLKATATMEKTLDPLHPDLALSYNNLSLIYKAQGQLEQALEFQLKAATNKEKILAPLHPDLATSYNNLAMIYQAQGQLEQALEYQLKATTNREKILAPLHPDLAASYNNLAQIYQDKGQLEQALEYQLKATTTWKKILAPLHPSLATTYSNLSTVYWAQGQLEQALEYQLKATTIREKILDPLHPDLATAYNNLARIYQDQGQLEQALEYQLKATTAWEKILVPLHPHLATSYNNLALIYQDQSQLEQALEYQLKATTTWEKILVPLHPSLATSYNNLAQIYQDQSQLEQALEYQLKSTTIKEKILAPLHPSLATAYNNLARIYQDQGEKQKAITYAQKAVNILEQLFPNGHFNLDTAKKNLETIKGE